MTKTLIDIDDAALTLAMLEYRTTTKVETVNRALREVARRRQQRVEQLLDTAFLISARLAESQATDAAAA